MTAPSNVLFVQCLATWGVLSPGLFLRGQVWVPSHPAPPKLKVWLARGSGAWTGVRGQLDWCEGGTFVSQADVDLYQPWAQTK